MSNIFWNSKARHENFLNIEHAFCLHRWSFFLVWKIPGPLKASAPPIFVKFQKVLRFTTWYIKQSTLVRHDATADEIDQESLFRIRHLHPTNNRRVRQLNYLTRVGS